MKNNFKKGMTLVEMLIAIFIFTIGILGFTELFIRSWRSNSFIMEAAQATRAAERGLNEIVKDAREARQGDDGSFAINSVDDFDLVFFSDVDDDGVTEKVHYFLDLESDVLKKGISNPSGSPLGYAEGDSSVSELCHYVVNTDAEPLFYFYDRDENLLSDPINLADVSLIKSVIWVNIKPETAPENVNLESLIQIRNLGETQ